MLAINIVSITRNFLVLHICGNLTSINSVVNKYRDMSTRVDFYKKIFIPTIEYLNSTHNYRLNILFMK